MNNIFKSENCPICELGKWEPKADEVHLIRHGRKTFEVDGLHYAICNKCGTRGYLPGQRKANQLLVQKFQETLPWYVSPSDVLAVREKYQLTQKQANEIFGGGSQGFSKWERGLTCPAGPTARLIKTALKYPEVMVALAKESGVNIAREYVSRERPHVFIVRSLRKITSNFEDNFANNGSSPEVEQDDKLWSAAATRQRQTESYLH